MSLICGCGRDREQGTRLAVVWELGPNHFRLTIGSAGNDDRNEAAYGPFNTERAAVDWAESYALDHQLNLHFHYNRRVNT